MTGRHGTGLLQVNNPVFRHHGDEIHATGRITRKSAFMWFLQPEYFSLAEIVNNPMRHPDAKAMNFTSGQQSLFWRNIGFYILYSANEVQFIIPWVACIYLNHITH
ncbi:hypothetical protein [Acetobacter peroxydans]|uniref:hypothetical protein n=1 Tax=Acetobacter peroxydans TaxID=104098 RepID=UPI00114449C7|nr:hypothetical protein [Acetobacter peroxydans]NHO14988.1 hypothetical protein [Acetobacter peroxydans]